MRKPNFKEDLLCNITLICTLSFTCIHLLLLTLNLFGVTRFVLHENFNYIVAYILVIASLALYVFGFYLYRFSNMYIPTWFRMLFYIAFYLFTNVYYILGCFNHLLGLIFFFAYVAFLMSIASLSIYFNSQKDEKNKLKIAPKSLLSSVYFYSIAGNALLQFIINLVKVIFFKTYKLSTLTVYLAEFGTMIGVATIVIILFAISLSKSKTFINACLIKFYSK